jgi:hypothetical protein
LIKRLIVPLFAVLAIGLVAAGCGSSDDSTTGSTTGSTDGGETSTASITKPELIKQGDEICTAGEEANDEAAEEYAEENGFELEKATKAQQEELIAEVFVPGIEAQAEEIAALGAPSGDEGEVEAILSAVESASEEAQSEPSLLFESGEGAGPFTEANELATEYGFKVCGEE